MRRVYIPHQQSQPEMMAGLTQAISAISPFPLIDGMPNPGEPLIVVVSNANMLLAAGALSTGHDIIVWAWNCPEVLAQRAENSHLVVYGKITPEDIEQTISRGVMNSPNTDALTRVEATFGFQEVVTA